MVLTSRWEDWHYIAPSNRPVVGLLAIALFRDLTHA